MNTAAGVFIAPVNGIYHFEFSGMKDAADNSASYRVILQVNGALISTSYATNALPNYLGLSAINTYLRLKSGDQVRLYKNGGTLFDDIGYGYTQFTGWLVEEDLVLI